MYSVFWREAFRTWLFYSFCFLLRGRYTLFLNMSTTTHLVKNKHPIIILYLNLLNFCCTPLVHYTYSAIDFFTQLFDVNRGRSIYYNFRCSEGLNNIVNTLHLTQLVRLLHGSQISHQLSSDNLIGNYRILSFIFQDHYKLSWTNINCHDNCNFHHTSKYMFMKNMFFEWKL